MSRLKKKNSTAAFLSVAPVHLNMRSPARIIAVWQSLTVPSQGLAQRQRFHFVLAQPSDIIGDMSYRTLLCSPEEAEGLCCAAANELDEGITENREDPKRESLRYEAGIPVLVGHGSLNRATASAWCVALFLVLFGVTTAGFRNVIVITEDLGAGAAVQLKLSNCDFQVMQGTDEASSISLHYWAPMHRDYTWDRIGACTKCRDVLHTTKEAGLQTVRVNLHMAMKSKYFTCVARLMLASDFKLWKLAVNSTEGSDHMLASIDHPALHVRQLEVIAGEL